MRWQFVRVVSDKLEVIGEVEADTQADALRIADASGLFAGRARGESVGVQPVGVPDGDDRPVGSVTLQELATAFGATDMAHARESARQQREANAKAAHAAAAMFKDVEGVREIHGRERLTTAEDVDVFTTSLKHVLTQNPNVAVVLMFAWVDAEGRYHERKVLN